MKTILVAIHGIMTDQTSASWPDGLQAFMAVRDPNVVVLKKEYRAGPFPRWNNLVKDPRLAKSIVNEIAAFTRTGKYRLWFVSHSNGAVIALHAIKALAASGAAHSIKGSIFTGAAIEADVLKNGLFTFSSAKFISWSNRGDLITDTQPQPGESVWRKMRDWVWGRLAWPYGSLGNTGWLVNGLPYDSARFWTRWTPASWGHSGYWAPWRRGDSFAEVLKTIHEKI